MKCIYKPIILDLMRNAALNSSSIAKLIVKELEEDREIKSKKHINYFDAYVNKTDEDSYIQFTACCKDVENPNFPDKDPDAMWKSEHRSAVSLTVFISRFESVREAVHYNKTIPETEIQYLRDILGMKPIHIEIWSGAENIEYAYNEKNYIKFGTDHSLSNSCMRYDRNAKYCGGFYGNIVNSKIMVAIDEDKKIYGRAIIWPEVYFSRYKRSKVLMDRCYYVDRGVLTLMYQYAQEHEFIRKTVNSFSDKDKFSVYSKDNGWVSFTNKARIYFNVDQNTISAFSGEVPYMDTFSYLYIESCTNKILFANTDSLSGDYTYIGRFTSTSGGNDISNIRICPICGTVHRLQDGYICSTCKSSSVDKFKTFGNILISMDNITIDGMIYPRIFIDENGNLKLSALNMLFIDKLKRD